MNKEVLEALMALGFELEEMEEVGYGFQYEGKKFLYVDNEGDENYLNIALPMVLDYDEENDVEFYQLMDMLNHTLKYVKAHKLSDSMWLFYERELFGNEDLKQVLCSMIIHLEVGLNFFRKVMAGHDGDSDTNDALVVADNEKDDEVA